MEPKLNADEVQAIVAGKEYPRVTTESIKEKIASSDFHRFGTTTICLITMKNGFKFVGTSTPADKRNYDADVGDHYAYENAFKQIWTHEGYLLRELLSRVEAK